MSSTYSKASLNAGNASAMQFEPEFIAGLREDFEKSVAFNQTIGLKIAQITPELVHGQLAMRPDLIGDSAYQRIHGGYCSQAHDRYASPKIAALFPAGHHRFACGLFEAGHRQCIQAHSQSGAVGVEGGEYANGISVGAG